MAEYIELEALETALNHRLNFLMAENGEYDHYTSGFYEAVTTVENFPAANVAPVRHGRWERDEWGSHLRRCSVCKKPPVYQDERGNSVAVYAGVCINCGAKMDSEVTNDA